MRNPIRPQQPAVSRGHRGFTLVELLVATTVSLFLLGGLFASLQSTRSAFQNQSALSQLQDNQRLAMTLMADVIEAAGYYPNPLVTDPLVVMPASGSFVAGQPMFGTYSAAAPGDSVTIRYGAGFDAVTGADNVFNCAAQQNTATSPYDTFVNRFYVAAQAADPASRALWCTATTAAGIRNVQLVNGVENLAILYGVARTFPNVTGSCSEMYLRADQMLAADWSNVCSVRVTLTFRNTLRSPTGSTTSIPITISRTIAVMNQAGINS
ncbi:MAG TPA: PilW family protein [Steroidobacteraceae bacterium]|nr:PilW family protein [Steroidobacteraceae bacterium]